MGRALASLCDVERKVWSVSPERLPACKSSGAFSRSLWPSFFPFADER